MVRAIYGLKRQALLKQKSNEFIVFLFSQRAWGTESEIDINLRGIRNKKIPQKDCSVLKQVPKNKISYFFLNKNLKSLISLTNLL